MFQVSSSPETEPQESFLLLTLCLRRTDCIFVSVSVLLGCSCCSAADETLEKVARGLASRMKRERSHWAAGRVGDIDFTGSTKKRGKVKKSGRHERYRGLYNGSLP